MEVFAYWPWLLPVVGALFGLIVGSFLNVVVYRLPIMLERAWRAEREAAAPADPPAAPPATATPAPLGEAAAPQRPAAGPAPTATFNLWWPPSACPHCGARIRPIHNVPVLSYVWLGGRCASCGAGISRRYPLIEAFVALASAVIVWRFGPTWACAAALLCAWMLVALAAIDLDHYLLPDSLTLSLLWLGLLLSLVTVDGAPLFVDPTSSILGAAFGYLSLWSVYHLFKLATGKEGMGYGDFKLLAALGAWLGWQMLPLIILLSAAVGAAVGITLIALGRHSREAPIPFGPYLAGAGFIALLFGDALVTRYLALLG